MKKSLVTILCVFSLTAHAREESGFDFFIGAAGWYTNADGSIEAPDINYTLKLKESDITSNYNSVVYASLKHPVKFLPDIMISQNNITHDGTGVLTYVASYPIAGTIKLSHTDITFFYNVLDTIGFIDIGATARIFNGEMALEILPSGTSSTSDLSTTLGLLYVHGGINLPLNGLKLGLTLNGGDNGSERSSDASFYIQYETPDGLGATYGYRDFNTDIESKGKLGPLSIDINADFNVHGPYLGIYYHL